MSTSAYPLKLPTSVKIAAARLTKADGVSLNQFIAVAVAEEVGVMETVQEFLQRRAAKATPKDLLEFLRQAGRERPSWALSLARFAVVVVSESSSWSQAAWQPSPSTGGLTTTP